MAMIKVGPVEKPSGFLWDEKGRGEIAQIFVSYSGDGVLSLQFLFYENDNLVLSNRHGSGLSVCFKPIILDYPSEFLTWISGSTRSWTKECRVLRSITFGTNKGSYGFGGSAASTVGLKDFSFQLGDYRSFGGFHGSVNDYGIESIGVYVKTITTSMIHSKVPPVKVKEEED